MTPLPFVLGRGARALVTVSGLVLNVEAAVRQPWSRLS